MIFKRFLNLPVFGFLFTIIRKTYDPLDDKENNEENVH